ncbi:hypothetical protein LTR17_018291 [Elasticomyces elasticus]|nr:hypothetical protein LTR17_018291 [Elasticomyces elasticus]
MALFFPRQSRSERTTVSKLGWSGPNSATDELAGGSTKQPSVKPEYWRIRNINRSEHDLAVEWLREQVKGPEILEGEGFSLVADGEQTLCATLTSFQQPIPRCRGWHLDKDFIGITPLCDSQDANIDVVAVTGLGGHALGSFRSVQGTSVWLRDFAARDVPQARFITYGYDTVVAASDSNQGIHELARTILDGLVIFRRRTHTQNRLLCFVGHSLGGVVLKEALIISSKATDPEHFDLHQISTCTRGLLLMGVPNLGLRHHQLQTVVQGQPNAGFIRDLLVQADGEPSQFLSYLTQEFARLCQRRLSRWRIVSYYETISSNTMAAIADEKFAMTGPKEIMVTKTSAERIGHSTRTIDHLPSHTDHRGLVRFEHRQDSRYVSLIEKIMSIAPQAPHALRAPRQP